jgi:hypothetical protein
VRLDDKVYAELVDVRVREPSRIAAALAGRRRRPTLAPDGVLFIVAADHTARGMLGVGGDPTRCSTAAGCWSWPAPAGSSTTA